MSFRPLALENLAYSPFKLPVLSPTNGTRTSTRSSIESQRLLSGVSAE
jgi:hypothetical protein